ncbi:MAG: PKD domain-containing protein [Thermoplasmata archaeon]|nr:PKD domain-containing protein [Thermoplasmata archaeon]
MVTSHALSDPDGASPIPVDGRLGRCCYRLADEPWRALSTRESRRRREAGRRPPRVAMIAVSLAILLLPGAPSISRSTGSSPGPDGDLHAVANPATAPVCNSVGSQFPSALEIGLPPPSEVLPQGTTIGVVYEFAVVSPATPASASVVYFPQVTASFPLSTGSHLQLVMTARSTTIPTTGWSDPAWASQSTVASQNLTFNTIANAVLNSGLVAIMATAEYGNLTLQFRWNWTTLLPNGTAIRSGWSVPSASATSPLLPSIFYPAPYVGTAGDSGLVVPIGAMLTDYLTGAISNTSFRVVAEFPNGSEFQSTREPTPPGNGTPFPASVPIWNRQHRLGPGGYIFHVHDRCNALVKLLLFHATYASSVQVQVLQEPGTCAPVLFNGTQVQSGQNLTVTPSLQSFNVTAGSCPGLIFGGWVTGGGVSAAQPRSPTTPVFVSSGGSLAAYWTAPSRPTPGYGFPTPIQHVFVVMMQSAERSQVLSSGPFQRELASTYAEASNYSAPCHPSEAGYVALTSGGIWQQCGSSAVNPVPVQGIGGLLDTAGLDWQGYFESMPSACDASDSYPYTAAHNAFLYFPSITSNASLCAAHDRSFAAWDQDVASGSIPNFGLFVPDLRDGGHDTGVAASDGWLESWLSPYLNASWFGQSVWFITYDEGATDAGAGGSLGGGVLLATVSPYSYGRGDYPPPTSPYDLLATVEWLLGLPVGAAGQNDSFPTHGAMREMFDFSPPGPLSGSASVDPPNGTAPLTTRFTGHGHGGAPPYGFAWSFGDGSTSTSSSPTHEFLSPGRYEVNLTVTDRVGNRTTASLEVTADFGPLSSGILSNRTSGTIPFSPSFTAVASGGLPPYSYLWSYGDASSTEPGVSVSHPYDVAGNYTVRLAVVDSRGITATSTIAVEAYAPLSVSLGLNATQPLVGQPVEALTTVAGGAPGVSYRWAVDGVVSNWTGSEYVLRPASTGPHVVAVVVTDSIGDTASAAARWVVRLPGQGSSAPLLERPIGPVPAWVLLAGVAILGAATYLGWRRWATRKGPGNRVPARERSVGRAPPGASRPPRRSDGAPPGRGAGPRGSTHPVPGGGGDAGRSGPE